MSSNLSFHKLELIISKLGFKITKIFHRHKLCAYLNLTHNDTLQTIYISISTRYEIPIPDATSSSIPVFKLKYKDLVDLQPDTEEYDTVELSSNAYIGEIENSL